MARFRFTLQSLLQYREHLRELALQALSEVLAEDGRLEAEQLRIRREEADVHEEMRQLNASGTLRVEQQSNRRYHLSQLTIAFRQLEIQRHLVQERIALCRHAVQKADQGVKVLENLRDDQRRAFQAEEDRKESRDLEDLWQAGQMRKVVK